MFSRNQMKCTVVVLGFLLGTAFLAACGGDDSAKDKCASDNDCSGARKCNYDKQAEIGQCMDATLDGFFMCSTSNPCPAGQFCFNGLCAPGCMTDGDCADNQYCDTLMEHSAHMCVNKQVSSCSSDSECAGNQACVMGLCSAVSTVQQCTPRPDGLDGCDEYSVCLDLGEGELEEYSCLSFPPCPQDGQCPTGLIGAVCNEGDIPNKARICLTGLCKTASNCPASFSCVLPGTHLGMCSNGTLGMPCTTGQDCADGLTCMGALSGLPGACVPGAGDDCESNGGSCASVMDGCPDGTEVDGTKSCSNMTELCCM